MIAHTTSSSAARLPRHCSKRRTQIAERRRLREQVIDIGKQSPSASIRRRQPRTIGLSSTASTHSDLTNEDSVAADNSTGCDLSSSEARPHRRSMIHFAVDLQRRFVSLCHAVDHR